MRKRDPGAASIVGIGQSPRELPFYEPVNPEADGSRREPQLGGQALLGDALGGQSNEGCEDGEVGGAQPEAAEYRLKPLADQSLHPSEACRDRDRLDYEVG